MTVAEVMIVPELTSHYTTIENDMDMDFQDDQCPMGYEMVAGKCQDVDECAEANGGCDQLCTNKPGSALCGCTRGYTLAEDGQRHVV